jgi:small subunit ribosomal protein S5
VRNILAKQLGSSNALNNARAAVAALDDLRTLADVAQERGISIEKLYG